MILHISNDFSGSTVYKNLINELDKLNFSQVVYNPIKEEDRIGKNKIDLKSKNSKIIYSLILNNYRDKLFYHKKITNIIKDIEQKVDLKKIEFVHAHTWYSDGGVAFEIYKKFKVPYIVTVRNTDLNYFFRYMLHLRSYGLQILENAEKIIFISPVYLERLFSKKYFQSKKHFLESKSLVIPNGVDQFWIENATTRKHLRNNELQVLYIGKFNKIKNVFSLVKVVEDIKSKGGKLHLNLVGGGGSEFKKILNYIKGKSEFSYYGEIFNKEDLKTMFLRNDVFAMPSHSETFGLVYIEALSQGIPVLYTRNEGIYGLYDNQIGEAVKSNSLSSIIKGIEKIRDNYSLYNFDPREIVNNHNWNLIALKYKSIYNKDF